MTIIQIVALAAIAVSIALLGPPVTRWSVALGYQWLGVERVPPVVEDVVQLAARYDRDTLVWELPFKEEDQQHAITEWTNVYQISHAHTVYTLDEFFQDCAHRDVWTEVQEKVGFGKVVAARCKRCRSTTIALMDDWLDARYKLSAKEGRCCVEVVDKAVCGCQWCENARRPPSQYRHDDYGS